MLQFCSGAIAATCTDVGEDLQEMLQEMREIQYRLVRGTYQFEPPVRFHQILLLADFGIPLDILKDFEGEVSQRYRKSGDHQYYYEACIADRFIMHIIQFCVVRSFSF